MSFDVISNTDKYRDREHRCQINKIQNCTLLPPTSYTKRICFFSVQQKLLDCYEFV